jgi:hypothetical protein
MNAQLHGLQRVVRALAQPATGQRQLYPPFAFPADEMILEFEQCFELASPHHADVWSGAQYSSLRALDERFRVLHGPGYEELWLAEDSLDHPAWSEIRRLARDVIRAFGWPEDEPPPVA